MGISFKGVTNTLSYFWAFIFVGDRTPEQTSRPSKVIRYSGDKKAELTWRKQYISHNKVLMRISFKGLGSTLLLIFGPSYLDGMEPRAVQSTLKRNGVYTINRLSLSAENRISYNRVVKSKIFKRLANTVYLFFELNIWKGQDPRRVQSIP